MSARATRRIVTDTVEGAGLPAPFKELILLALAQPGRILHEDTPSHFPAFIEACCIAAHGDVSLVPRTAASFELCIAASDVLDEIEDADESQLVKAVGVPRALNATTALLGLSHLALSAGSEVDANESTFLALNRSLAETIVSSTVGQDHDLMSSSSDKTSISVALEIARKKSGSLVAGACQLGCMLGTRDPEIMSLYHEFGVHLGTAHQLANDLHDAASPSKSDRAQSRNTVPLTFHDKPLELLTRTDVDDTMLHSGALHFTWVLIETERLRCEHIIDSLLLRGHEGASLRALLGSR